ncbi:phage tail protein [Pseudomonas fluorescens]|nr:phage tail protein [Pseudomonas fluorescens]
MNDQYSKFQAILTAVGEAKQANADALGIPWTFAQMAVGDANGIDPIPDRLQTKLINERRRAPLNQLKPDSKNPGVIIAEQVIPESVGGFWIRELGLYDQDGDLVAVANCPGTYKPLMDQGSGRTQIIRMNLIVSSLANIVLKIDPSVVLATRQYVDESLETILPGNKTPGTFHRVTINKYGVVQSGTNPTTLAGFGITDAYTKTEAGQSFASRAVTLAGYNIGDAYTKNQVDWSLSNKADKATTLAGYGITDAYTKTEAGQSFASRAETLAGYNIGDAYTKTQIDGSLSSKADKATTLAGYGITDAYTKTEAGQSFASRAVTLAGYNIGDAYTKTQIDGSLSSKADKATTLAGYGITDAYTRTQTDQRLDGKAPNVAASESVAGISAVSTQNQTNAGLDDATFVTPKKLRAGFLSSFTLNGFIAFPSWLGGLIIQWGRTASLGDGNSTTVSLPLTFPATTLQIWTSIYGDVSGDSTACRVSAGQFLSLSQIKVSYNETTSALGGAAVTWICVGF